MCLSTPTVSRVVIALCLLSATGPPLVRARSTDADNSLPQVLVSRQLLEQRGLAVGQIVTFSVDPAGSGGREFRIAGVYEPTPDPMRLTSTRFEARAHLPDLLGLVSDPRDPQSAEQIGAINVALRNPGDAATFARDLGARMPGLIVSPAASPEAGSGPFAVLKRFHLAISVVTVLGSTAFLLALMVMRADERREMVGILRVIGFSKGRVLVEVLLEGLLVAFSGAAFGVLFAAATEGAVNRLFQWRYDTALVFVHVTPRIAVECVAVAVPLGALAGIVASWTVLRREIAALLRR